LIGGNQVAQQLNTKTSVVDYLKSQGQDSSMANRTQLAGQYGISGYTGSYQQNVQLLSSLQQAGQPAPIATKPTAVPQTVQATQPSGGATGQPVTAPQSAPAPQQTAQVTQQSSALQQQEQTLNQAYEDYKNFLIGSRDSFYDEQKSMLEGARDQRLIDLQKALERAVADGEMSQQEAEKQFQRNVDAIQDGAYLNSQATNLSGEQRGIGNSQQLLAMQQGDQRHTQSVMQEARTARDDRINEIKHRISQITSEHDLDVIGTNSAFNSDLARANAQANQMYFQGMGNLSMSQIQSAQEMKNSLMMLDEQTRKQMEIMAKQHGYDLDKMSISQQYQLAQMAKQQDYTKENMAINQGYTRENMATQQKYTLEQFAKQHGYDLQKMSTQQQYQLAQMATQNGYNIDMANLNFGHQKQLSQQEYQQALSKAEHSTKLQLDATRQEYDMAMQRELAKYTPGSQEYQIRKGQLEAEREALITEMHSKLMYDAQMGIILGGQTQHPGNPPTKKWFQTQGSFDKEMADYNKKVAEYEKYQKSISNPMSLFP